MLCFPGLNILYIDISELYKLQQELWKDKLDTNCQLPYEHIRIKTSGNVKLTSGNILFKCSKFKSEKGTFLNTLKVVPHNKNSTPHKMKAKPFSFSLQWRIFCYYNSSLVVGSLLADYWALDQEETTVIFNISHFDSNN